MPVRFIAIGVISDNDLDSVAAAVARTLDVELQERDGLNIGGGRYWTNWALPHADPEVRLVHNYGPDEPDWKYKDDQDATFVVEIETSDEHLDAQDVVMRLGRVAPARILSDG